MFGMEQGGEGYNSTHSEWAPWADSLSNLKFPYACVFVKFPLCAFPPPGGRIFC